MKKIKIQNILVSLLFIAQGLLVGCDNYAAKSNKAGSHTFQDYARKTQAECLNQIKEKMLLNQLSFDASVSNKIGVDITPFQKNLTELTDKNLIYSRDLNIESQKVSALSLYQSEGNLDSTTEVSIPENSPDFFTYEVSITQKNGENQMALTQNFNVDTSCKARLVLTAFDKQTRTGQTLQVDKVTLNPGELAGALNRSSNNFDLPDKFFNISTVKTDTIEDLQLLIEKSKTSVIYIADNQFGLIINEISALGTETHFDPIIDKDTQFDKFKIDLTSEGELIFSVFFSFSRNSDFSYSVMPEVSESQHISKALWLNENSLISKARDNEVVADSATYGQTGLSRMQLASNQKYQYENLAPYWTLEKNLPADETWTNNQIFISHGQAAPQNPAKLVPVTKNPSDPYLQAAEYIQINAPEVQALIQTLTPYLYEDRFQMAQRIAALVQSHITFDTESMNNNEIYALTTLDVLSRTKGVCQHFANLFTAIARGVGLPTKIISGYYISKDKIAGPHAWNEIEIQNGVWLPIEPQRSDLLIADGHYLPTSVSTLLETGRYSASELNGMGLFRFKFTLLAKVAAQ